MRNICRIRKYLTKDSVEIIIHALITAKLDYCNSLLYGLHKRLISKLQSVQNSAARVVTMSRKYNHITPVLIQLHCTSLYIIILSLKCIWHEFFYFLKWKNSLSCSVTYFSVSCFYGLFSRYFNLLWYVNECEYMSANLWCHVVCKLFKMVEYHCYHPRW
jgi:hypothetical protein